MPVKQMIHFCSLGVSALINEISSGIVLIGLNLSFYGWERRYGSSGIRYCGELGSCCSFYFYRNFTGVQPMISRFHGKKDKKGAWQVYKYGIIVSVGFGILLLLCVLFFTPQLVEVFNSEHDPMLARMAEEGLHLYFIGFLL